MEEEDRSRECRIEIKSKNRRMHHSNLQQWRLTIGLTHIHVLRDPE
jgi:hypothetical protein